MKRIAKMKVDHIGIVVRDITKHFNRHLVHLFPKEWLGSIIYDPLQKVKVAFIEAPGGRIELVEPAAPDSPVSSLAAKKPACYYHICLEVNDLNRQLNACHEKNQLLVSPPKPAVAFGGRRIAFVLGKDMLLWEFLEAEGG